MPPPIELLQGTLDVLILKAISLGPLHGYGVLLRIQQVSHDKLKIQQGSLYPVLRSLEKGGLVASQVEPSISGPPRRYYQITPSGRDVLAQWVAIWQQNTTFVDAILEGTVDVSKH